MIKQFPINTASNHSLIMPQKRQKAFHISPSQTKMFWQTYTKDKLFQYGLNLAPRVATFAQMPRLQHLAEVEVRTFAQMPRLNDLRRCRGWTICADAAAQTFAQMSRLKHLAVAATETFAQMPQLKHLRSCRGWNICADAAAETFAQMPQLKHLRRCRGWNICADAAEQFIAKNPQLIHVRRCRGVLQQTWLHLLRAVAVVGVILIVISLGGSDPSCTIHKYVKLEK